MIVTLSLPFETKSPGWKAQQLKGKMRKKQLCKQWTADHLSSFSPSSRRLSFWSIFLQIFSPNFRHLKKRTAKKEQCLLLTPPFCQSPRPRSTRVFNCGTAKLKVAMTEKRPGTFGVCVCFDRPVDVCWANISQLTLKKKKKRIRQSSFSEGNKAYWRIGDLMTKRKAKRNGKGPKRLWPRANRATWSVKTCSTIYFQFCYFQIWGSEPEKLHWVQLCLTALLLGCQMDFTAEKQQRQQQFFVLSPGAFKNALF